jgi:hypothetical protein
VNNPDERLLHRIASPGNLPLARNGGDEHELSGNFYSSFMYDILYISPHCSKILGNFIAAGKEKYREQRIIM